MTVDLSVVVPVHDGAATIGECLRALTSQTPRDLAYEVIVVDDGSTDATAAIVESTGVRLVQQPQSGAGAARNTGWRTATGSWIAFTDADCVPSRSWLRELVAAVDRSGGEDPCFGAAGRTIGHRSATPAARYADLAGALDARRHLAHPVYPFAPTANVMYRRDALDAVGGFDERYVTYEAADLHTRLREHTGGDAVFAPRAVVLHRHRATWGDYWRQQRAYGRGYAQFCRWRAGWSAADELRAMGRIGRAAARAAWPTQNGDDRLVARGQLVKEAAQRIGFWEAYVRPHAFAPQPSNGASP